ncbi:MAG TPA: formate--tetrahydrofolate ligase, partial [Armatimonadota bacterium]|nr:formate--tetrahydrofolate ligase [Armatimonadota bacterium]
VANVHAHIDNLRQHGVPVVVAVNRFGQDSDDELSLLCELVEAHGAPCEVTDGFAEGSRGAMRLAERVLELVDSSSANFHTLYPDEMGLTEKVETIATRVYGADGVDFLPAAARALSRLEELGLGRLPVCMAKTQYSLTDDPKIVGRPRGFRITVRDAYPSTGAGFVVCLTGEVMTMPAMSRTPAAIGMDIAEDGTITGLF